MGVTSGFWKKIFLAAGPVKSRVAATGISTNDPSHSTLEGAFPTCDLAREEAFPSKNQFGPCSRPRFMFGFALARVCKGVNQDQYLVGSGTLKDSWTLE